MQNSNPKNIDFVADMKDLDEIKMPKRISFETILFGTMMIAFEIWFIFLKDWIQVVLYGFVVCFYITRAIWVYRANNKTIKLLNTLKRFNKALREIKNTPVLREEGKSIIFTFLSPSPKLMKELEKFSHESK